MMEKKPDPISKEEIIKKWREENKDKLSVQNKFMTMPDGTVAEVTEKNEDDLKEEYHDQFKDLNS